MIGDAGSRALLAKIPQMDRHLTRNRRMYCFSGPLGGTISNARCRGPYPGNLGFIQLAVWRVTPTACAPTTPAHGYSPEYDRTGMLSSQLPSAFAFTTSID